MGCGKRPLQQRPRAGEDALSIKLEALVVEARRGADGRAVRALRRPLGAAYQANAAARPSLRRRRTASVARPKKPIPSIAQVEGSGAPAATLSNSKE